MLRFTEVQLTNETGLPNHGRLVWTSNWAPNYKGAYAHSTRDLVFAEGLNLAVAYYHAGQYDKGYDLLKGAYASMFQGSIPGGLSCHAYRNGQQRRNEEFTDGISLFARVVVEGLYGIVPEFQNDILHLSPGFPKAWNQASIRTPDVSYEFRRTQNEITIHLTSQRRAQIHYKVGILDQRVSAVFLDGKEFRQYTIEPGVGRAFVHVTTPSMTASTLEIRLAAFEHAVRFPAVVAQSDPVSVTVEGAQILHFNDPQQVLTELQQQASSLTGIASASIGHHTFFVRAGSPSQSYWHPVDVEIRPRLEIMNAGANEKGECSFRLRNNTANQTFRSINVEWCGARQQLQDVLRPGESRDCRLQGAQQLMPGGSQVVIAGSGFEKVARVLPYWPSAAGAADVHAFQPVAIDSLFDESPETVLQRNIWSDDRIYAVCFDYFLAHLNGDRSRMPNASRLRGKVDARGIALTDCGIPFAQRAIGNNMVALSLLNGFRPAVRIPIGHAARRIYLLLGAITFPIQSHIPNGRVTVGYENGTQTSIDLVNPTNLDSGLGTFGGTYHYTPNGREVIGALPPFTLPPQPTIILRQHGVPDKDEDVHPAWENSESTRPPLAAHADILAIDVDHRSQIDSLHVDVIANDVVLGLFGVTILV